jgi:hypothetical protein
MEISTGDDDVLQDAYDAALEDAVDRREEARRDR